MNHLFYPSQTRESKSGLEKHRKIKQYDTDKSSDSIMRNNIPDSWFYNDNAAEKVWKELEETTKEHQKEIEIEVGKNPFSKIDESAHKIRQMIDNFEIEDQEFLVTLMDLLEDETAVDSLDQSDILIEAKFRLAAMIGDHAGNTDAQSKMLDSLKYWFNRVMEESQANVSNEATHMKEVDNIDVTKLAEMINKSFEIREMSSDQLQTLHRSVVDTLSRQIRDLQRKLHEQDETIDELNKTIEAQQKGRRSKLNKKKDSVAVLNSCQRKICEQESKITNLKQSITEISGEILSARSTLSQEADEATRSTDDPIRSLQRELEMDGKIRALNETISQLRGDLNETNAQLRKSKQNEIILENKMQSLDRAKKNAEQSLSNTNEKYNLMEKNFKAKIDEMMKNNNQSAILDAQADLKAFYDKRIQDIYEANRTAISEATDKVEKRYKKQMSDMYKTIESGDTNAAINELNIQHIGEVDLIKEECQNEIKTLKAQHGQRLTILTRHYETKMTQMLNDQKRIQESLKRDVDAHVEEKKIEMEEDFSKRMIEFQDKAATELSTLRQKFEEKIGKLKDNLRTLKNERDVMKEIIDENELNEELPEEFEQNMLDDDDIADEDDNILAESMIQLKEREIEKMLSQKYNSLLKAQRDSLEDSKNWEIEQLKQNMKDEMNKNIIAVRQEMMDKLCQMRDLMSNNPNNFETEDFDNLMVSALQSVENHDSEIVAENESLKIPLHEVESRMAESNAKLNELTGENEFLRMTLQQLNNGKELKGDNNEDLIRAMRSSVADQATKMKDILQEYNDMKVRLSYYEEKEQKHEYRDEEIQFDEKAIIYSKSSNLIFSKHPEEIIESNTPLKNEKNDDEELVIHDKESSITRRRRTPNSRRDSNFGTSSATNEGSQDQLYKNIKTQTNNPNLSTKKRVKKKNHSIESNTATKSTDKVKTHSLANSKLSSKSKSLISKNSSKAEFDSQDSNHQITKSHSISNENEVNDECNEQSKETDSEYEYEYAENLSIVMEDILNIPPSPTRIFDNNVECPNCHKVVIFDPDIVHVSETTNPVIECPGCFNAIHIDRSLLTKLAFGQNHSFTEEELSQISEMEQSIQNQIQSLIDMKHKMRDGEYVDENIDPSQPSETSHFRPDLAPSLPTVVTLPTPQYSVRKSDSNPNINAELKVTIDSLAIEIPDRIPNELMIQHSMDVKSQPLTSRRSPLLSGATTNRLSTKSFTVEMIENFTKDQIGQITDAETKIDDQIAKLLELKEAILSKKQYSSSNSPSRTPISPKSPNKPINKSKLKITSYQDVQIESVDQIAPEISMNEVQLERKPTTNTNPSEDQLDTNIQYHKKGIRDQMSDLQTGFEKPGNKPIKLSMQQSSDMFFPVIRPNLSISETINEVSYLDSKQQEAFKQNLAVQAVAMIEISQQQQVEDHIKQLDMINKTVLTLTKLEAFSTEEDNSLATNIINEAQSLKDLVPPPAGRVEEVLQSARKLLINLCPENAEISIEPLSTEAGNVINSEQSELNELRTINQKYKNDLVFITESHNKLKNDVQDMHESTKELKSRHEEIVQALQLTIENIMNALKKGNGTIDPSSLSSIKEQSEYLVGSIKEKESLQNDIEGTTQLLKEREMKIISMTHDIQEKDLLIEDLIEKSNLMAQELEKLQLVTHGDKDDLANMIQTDEDSKKFIETLSEEIIKAKENEKILQTKIDKLELLNEQLQNKIALKESEEPVFYSVISPFLIFDSLISRKLPSKGITLLPGKNCTSANYGNSNAASGNTNKEKIRVKYGQNQLSQTSSPKLVVPKSKQSRLGARNSSANNSTTNSNRDVNYKNLSLDGYSEFIPVHGEDPNSFVYIRKLKLGEANLLQSQQIPEALSAVANYYDKDSVHGSVVFQKTFNNINKRIHTMENILQLKAHEMIKLRDQKNEAKQNLYRLSIQYQRIEKNLKRLQFTDQINNEKLLHAYKIIEERDLEIRQLRDLVKQLRSAAQNVTMHDIYSRLNEDQSNLAAMRAFRNQTILNEVGNAYRINPTLKRLAQRQAAAVSRWEKRRQDLLIQQQNHMIAVLQGLRLIDPIKARNSSPRSENVESSRSASMTKTMKSQRGSIIITSLNATWSRQTGLQRNLFAKTMNTHNRPNFDESWKNVNAHNQKIPRGLKEGVIATPLE
ncbi:hypothetical protein TRFO_27412 [Tritrichomonas foetus]|uniref:Uncharacterized protein n=1 Tax=Tritrichomonas foetus TaxID=1144522 RepID=A0A1J4K2E9_9EUKA|nr:hypothetical protein TRFO_27412 [Tritrichomonas foetus]|eukprot:OHT04968.1 hypothetical protein TRFO_27412 [Tritrichomonas foetus]